LWREEIQNRNRLLDFGSKKVKIEIDSFDLAGRKESFARSSSSERKISCDHDGSAAAGYDNIGLSLSPPSPSSDHHNTRSYIFPLSSCLRYCAKL
jgi:hypothetical protein